MKLNIDVPVNIGDTFYYISKISADETAYNFGDIQEEKVDSFIVNKEGIFIIDDLRDWYGRADKMDCPISETEFIAPYTTKENAQKAIEEWNKRYGKESD